MDSMIPKFPLAKIINAFIDWTTENFAFITNAVSNVMEAGIEWLVAMLYWPPAPLVIIAFAALTWFLSKNRRVGLFALIGLAFIWNLGLWEATIQTLALVIIATAIAIAVGIPLGIVAAMYKTMYRITMPILDFMQTMPAFVYLIPAIPFFGLGPVAAIFSTVIFSMPPAIRLTTLGIKQVPEELIEAADAFGSTRSQKLVKLQLPLATPTIMAGINQTIMLSLSMVVIAAMIGARGLGGEVWRAIQRLQPGAGFEAGLGVVIVAIILDRITQRIGQANAPTE